MNGALERVEILLKQQRLQDARELLAGYLDENPQDFRGRYFMAAVMLESDEKEDAETYSESQPQVIKLRGWSRVY